jgi:hypothetical protein
LSDESIPSKKLWLIAMRPFTDPLVDSIWSHPKNKGHFRILLEPGELLLSTIPLILFLKNIFI